MPRESANIRSLNFFDDLARMKVVEKMEVSEKAPENSSSVRGRERERAMGRKNTL